MKKFIIALFSIMFSTSVYASEVTGAGATFPYPIYAKWADAWSKATGNRINYQSIGSGAGIKQIQARTVAFGASDMPLPQDILDRDGLFQFPTVVGGNVLIFNIDGIKTHELKLTDQTIADIYLGKIKTWNDPVLVKLNPGLKLPNTAISVVRRSDGSGTTFIFTRYLSGVSEEWRKRVGTGTAVEWPVGVGARGNEGVAANVRQTRNSIGYVEYAYAKQNDISYSTLNGVLPGIRTFQNGEWPIAAPTFIIMPKKPNNTQNHRLALEFFLWAFRNGDAMAEELDYVPLSTEEKNRIIKEWNIE
jgi:phosphate transport system substrate-binding protein